MPKGPHSLSRTDLCPSVLFPPTCSRRTAPGRKTQVQWWARAGQGGGGGGRAKSMAGKLGPGPPRSRDNLPGASRRPDRGLVARAAQSRWPEAGVHVGRPAPTTFAEVILRWDGWGASFPDPSVCKSGVFGSFWLGVCHAHLFPQRATSTGSWEGGVHMQPLPALPLTLPLLGCCSHPVPPPRPSSWLPDTPTGGTAPQLGTSPRPSRAGSSSHP